MKKLIKILYPYFFPVIVITFLIFSFNVLKKEFQFGYQSANVYQSPFSWQKQLFFSEIFSFKNKILKNFAHTDFPKIRIYVSEQNVKHLINNLPDSSKNWVKAYIQHPDQNNHEFQIIELRYRGDNPNNWLKTKKELRIKTKKNELIKGYRNLDYHAFTPNKYFTYFISDKMGLLNQKYNLVELYINDESNGLYLEQEKIDETFLRKNNLMPINIYKGENSATEYYFGLNKNIFNNPALWTKEAEFNQEKNNDDLIAFMKELKKNYYKSNEILKTYIDINYFSKLEALLAITNNSHHDYYHNMRLVLDPWKGTVTQLLVDPWITDNDNELDFAANDLSELLNRNTKYVHEKYKWIYYYLTKDNVIDAVKKNFDLNTKSFREIQKLEPYNAVNINHITDIETTLFKLNKNKEKILKKLNNNPNGSWYNKNLGIDLIINDYTPLYNVEVKFKNNIYPEWIGLDLNYDNLISPDEPKFYFDKMSKKMMLPLFFYSNRVKINNTSSFQFSLDHSNTYYSIIFDSNAIPEEVLSTNYFSKKIFSLKEVKKNNNSVKINFLNNAIFSEEIKTKKKIILSDTFVVDKNKIFENEVIIEPGTIFLIKPGKHIIFKNKVFAKGTKAKPILFQKFDKSDEPWGTVALIGKQTSGSEIENVIFSGGSGGHYNQFKFTSMFSVHDTFDIKIVQSDFFSNELFDDAIHIIYSKNILLDRVRVIDSFADAIDIDISKEVVIQNTNINNSKNDGIDFMESSALIQNVNINNSKDKAISIGEGSNIIIKNSKFTNSQIGTAVKDKSFGKFYNVQFLNNKIQLASYAKNWRYGGGGYLYVYDSTIKAEENKFITLMDPDDLEKKNSLKLNQNSEINIINSSIIGNKKVLGDNFFIK